MCTIPVVAIDFETVDLECLDYKDLDVIPFGTYMSTYFNRFVKLTHWVKFEWI